MNDKEQLKTTLETQGVRFRCFYRTDKSIVRIYIPQVLRNNKTTLTMVTDLFDNAYTLDYIDSYPDNTDKFRLLPKCKEPLSKSTNEKKMKNA